MGAPGSKKKQPTQHNWWKYLLCFVGGFAACGVAIVGGVAIAGTAVRVSDLTRMAGQDPNEFIGEEYLNDSLLSMITKLSTQKFETLGDLNKVSPQVRKLVEDTINPAMNSLLGFEFDWDEIQNKPFVLDASSPRPETEYDHTTDLSTYLPEKVEKGIKIGNFFKDEHGNVNAEGLLKYIVYPVVYDDVSGKYVVDTSGELVSLYDIMNGGSSFFDNVKNAIVIGDVVDTSGSPFLAQVADWTLNDFNDANIKTLEIGLLFDPIPADNVLLQTIADNHWTINSLSDFENIKGLRLDQVLDTSTASDFIQSIAGNTFNDIMEPGFIDTLELREIFPDATGVLKALSEKSYIVGGETQYYTVGDLKDNDRVLALTIGELFDDLHDGDLLYAFRDDTLQEISNKDVATVRIADIFTASQINDNKILKAIVDDDADATIGDLTDQETINGLALSDVVDTSGSKVLTSLAAKGATIGTLSTAVESLTLSEAMDIGTDPDAMIYKVATSEALADTPISEIPNKFGELKLSDIFTPTASSPRVLTALCEKGSTLETLEADMNSLTMKDVMEIHPGDIFKHVIDSTTTDYYVLFRSGWTLLEGASLTAEYDDYYDSTTGYIATGKAVEFTDSEDPFHTSLDLSGAVARDPFYSVKDTSINDSNTILESLKNSLILRDLIDIDENTPRIIRNLANTNLCDLSDVVKTMKLREMIDIGATSSPILKMLSDVVVFGEGNTGLKHALENLNLVDLFADNLFLTGAEAESRNAINIHFTPKEADLNDGNIQPGAAMTLGAQIVARSGKSNVEFIHDSFKNDYFLKYCYSGSPYTAGTVDAAIKQAYQYVTGSPYDGSEVFSETDNTLTVDIDGYEVEIEHFEARKFDMTYWFMFTEDTETFSAENRQFILEKGYTYTIQDLGKLSDNMTHHIKTEPIRALVEAHLIDVSFDLDKELKSSITVPGHTYPIPHGGEKIGDLTVSDILEVLEALLPLIAEP